MAKRTFRAGATSQTIDVFIQDSSSTTGAGLSGLAYNTSGLKAYYRNTATGSATAITLATQTVGGAYSSGGFVEIDATNMKGVYRLDLPNAALTSSPFTTVYIYGATNAAPCVAELEVVAYDPFDTVRLGLTALPNVASGNSGAIVTAGTGTAQISTSSGQVILQTGTGTGQLDFTSGVVKANVTQFGGSAGTFASGRPEVNTTHAAGTAWGSGAITAAAIASDAITAAKIADGAIDAATFAAGAITASAIAADAIGASELAADAVTEIAAAISIPSAATIADAVWDEATSGHLTAGTFGAIVDETHSHADGMMTAFEVNGDVYDLTASAVANVWDVATSGHTTSGTFGEQCKTDIDDILTDTGTTLDGRIPVALVGGRMDASVGAHSTAAKAEIKAEVVDVLATDTYAEPGQGTPAATLSLAAKIGYLFKAWRNRSTQTSTDYKLYGDDATTVDQKATVSDDATTFDRNEITTGP